MTRKQAKRSVGVFLWVILGLALGVSVVFQRERAFRAPIDIGRLDSGLRVGSWLVPETPLLSGSPRRLGSVGVAEEVDSTGDDLEGSVEFRTLDPEEMGLTAEEACAVLTGPVPREVPGRRIPDETPLVRIAHGEWAREALPLPEANTLDHWYFQQWRWGVLDAGEGGPRIFVPQVVLVKHRRTEVLLALRVSEGAEIAAIRLLRGQSEVEYAGLNTLQRRTRTPNDPELGRQWHHEVLGSREAWSLTTGDGSVRVAIMDGFFQMNHPDLAANVRPGWNVLANAPATNGVGIAHATGAAGLVAAVLNNGRGVAGMGNCAILPIVINGTLAEMYLGTLWAATNGVRVVNISWTGAQDPIINSAGQWIQTHARGVLAIAGGNTPARLNYTNKWGVLQQNQQFRRDPIACPAEALCWRREGGWGGAKVWLKCLQIRHDSSACRKS
jgi:hypothetical protein